MEARQQRSQHKEMATRPKLRSRESYTVTQVQADNIVTSAVKRNSKKIEKPMPSEVDYRCNGHTSGRKTRQESSRVQQSNTNSEDETDQSNHLPLKLPGKQRLKDTPAKQEKAKGTSGSNHKIEQLTANVMYPANSLHNATAKKSIKKLTKSKSLDSEAHSTEDHFSTNKTLDKPQKVRNSNDDLCKIEQQAKEVSEKRASGRTSKQEKKQTSNLDNDVAPEVKGRDVRSVNSGTPRKLKDVVDGKLRLKMEDISNAAQKVNKVVDKILKSPEINAHPLFNNVTKMSTGSYYEHVKIAKPSEFDIMLSISLKSYNTIKLTNIDKKNPFYTLAFKNRIPPDMRNYMDNDGLNISSRKIVNDFRVLIKQVISNQEIEGVSLDRKDRGSPAVTLTIKNEAEDISVDLVLALKIVSRWPEETNDGMNIDDWLGTKVKREFKRSEFFMVPKQAIVRNKAMTPDTWRISFSKIEKEILSNHGNEKTCCETGGSKKKMCCRKQCLKLLKYLLELLKNDAKPNKMDQFCSYHAKTALFHHCAEHPKDDDWKLEDLEPCFNRYVDFFLDCLRRCTLYNFFLPHHNLFSEELVHRSNCEYLYKEIDKHKTDNFSIFHD